MDYQRIYHCIINNSLAENRMKGSGVYFELHHILPRSLGGNDESSNLVLLTAREHLLCHILLTKIFTDKVSRIKMQTALHRMMNGRSGYYKANAKKYQYCRSIILEKCRETGKKNLSNYNRSELHKKQLNESQLFMETRKAEMSKYNKSALHRKKVTEVNKRQWKDESYRTHILSSINKGKAKKQFKYNFSLLNDLTKAYDRLTDYYRSLLSIEECKKLLED